MSRKDATVSFALWPHLVTIEGQAARIAAVLDAMYNDGRIERNRWSLANAEGAGRRVRSDAYASKASWSADWASQPPITTYSPASSSTYAAPDCELPRCTCRRQSAAPSKLS